MKKIMIIVLLLTMNLCVKAQSYDYAPQMATTSIENKDAKFLLFPTKNMYIFLKLDTSSGELWMVQYTTGSGHSMEVKYHDLSYPLVTELQKKPGRFFLYPTQNMYNFLLIDQVDGRVWQAQWAFEPENIGIFRIY